MEKSKRKKVKILPIIFGIFLLIYFIFQLYLMSSNKIETVKATEGFINDSILSSGIICRKEIILPEQASGIARYNVEDGQRVSNGMIIGEIYESAADIKNIQTVERLEQELENIKSAQNFMSAANVDISITRKQLNNNIIYIAQNAAISDYSAVCESLPTLLFSINKINVATGAGGNLDSTKEIISQEISGTKGLVAAPLSTVHSQSSGYFIKGIDGYEDAATVENFKNLSVEDGEAIITKPNIESSQQQSFGKIITDYKWNLCTYVSNQEAEKLQIDQSVQLALDSEQSQYQKSIITDIVPLDGKSLIVLQSSTMDEKSAAKRIVDCEILFRQYKGIKIPRAALHIVDENLGVYVKFSKLVQFKKVKPIFEDENYVILPIDGDENNEVSLYDDIIVRGISLYDGKYL